MKPIIGITSTIVKLHEYSEGAYVHKDYHRSVEASGGLPLVLPLTSLPTFKSLLDLCDGVIFSGGEDVDPAAYGMEPVPELGTIFPERDQIELEAVRYVLEADKPLLAICRGSQVLNVALGGTLYQDLPSQWAGAIGHMQRGVARGKDTHSVELTENSRLHRIFGEKVVRVNSLHHQALRDIGADLIVTAASPDGVVEAVEHTKHSFAVGVQWHPESMSETDDTMKLLFQALIAASREKAREKKRL